MGRAHYDEFEGIVMSVYPHREKDMLVKLFTNHAGKRMFFIRGLKQSNHPLSFLATPLTKAQLVGQLNPSGFSFVTTSKATTYPRVFQTDVTRHAYGIYFVQLADAAVEDFIKQPVLYTLLADALAALAVTPFPEVVALWYEVRLLTYFGIAINWLECAFCHSRRGPFDFSLKHHGVICPKHLDQDPYRMQTSPKAVYWLGVFSRIQVQQIGQVQLKRETSYELRRLIDAIYDDYVGIRLKSKGFLQQLKQFESDYGLANR